MADTEQKALELKTQVDSEIKMTLNQAISAMKQEIVSLISMKVIQPPVNELFKQRISSVLNHRCR